MVSDIVKVFIPTALAFLLGIALTPILTHYLYKYRMWKKVGGKRDYSGNETVIFNSLHKEGEIATPRLGGVIIWGSATVVILTLWGLARLFPIDYFIKLDFLSRSQTWLPLFTLVAGSLIGLVDDLFEIRGGGGAGKQPSGGLSLSLRLFLVRAISLFVAWGFYEKLGVHAISVPFSHQLDLGLFFIPFFVLVTLFLYAGGIIDGIDGLAGGIFASIFSAYAIIAFYQSEINLAAFAATISGAILAFLWFNIPPARFYMSETGTMGLTITLAVIAFFTDQKGGGYGVVALPLIAFPLVLTVGSAILQVVSKRFRKGKKIFLVAPLHHHFEALGWPSYKVTMRYWIIGIVCALVGVIVALI